MKKIMICLIMISLLAGCDKKEKETITDKELKNKLLEMGKDIYESDSFNNNSPSNLVYFMDLKTLKEIGKDISLFIKRNCDLERTKIEFKIIATNNEIEYQYSPILDCK